MKTEEEMSVLTEYLNSLNGIKQVEPKDSFYNSIVVKLENEQPIATWIFPLKPVWMVSTLLVLLMLNTFLFTQKRKSSKADEPASIEGFAQAYDQQISTY